MLFRSVNEAGGGFHFFVNGRFEMASWLENPMHCIALHCPVRDIVALLSLRSSCRHVWQQLVKASGMLHTKVYTAMCISRGPIEQQLEALL